VDSLTLHLWTCDAGAAAAGTEDYAAQLGDRVRQSWDAGADLVVLPEFAWLGVERFMTSDDPIAGVGHWFWGDWWPRWLAAHSRPDKAVVLGTVPFVDEAGRKWNRAPILSSGRVLHQDKIHLTPWESAFAGGGPLRVWEFRGHRLAVLVCLDVEVPELAAALRGSAVDLLLVPSATETILGVERVNRCAAARAVELGCHVAVCPLLGNAASGLVDVNIGRLACYAPSQAAFAESARTTLDEVRTGGFHRLAATLDLAALRALRAATGETAPSLLTPCPPRLEFC
jgi:predicted amidohydrolase